MVVKGTEIYLQVAYVKPSPGVLMGVGHALEKNHKALYPFTRSELRTFNIPEQYQDIYLDNIFQDIVPSLIMVGLVDGRAKNSSFNKNPFNFQPYDVRQVGISVDGAYVPGLPQKVNFDNGQNYVAAYKNFMGCHRTSADNVGITLAQFKDGFTLFTFSLQNEAGGDDPEKNLALVRHGSVRLEMIFGTKLPHTVSIVVYCEYPSMFTIDKVRRVELI